MSNVMKELQGMLLASGLSQSELARMTGLAQPVIGRIMNGQGNITVATLERLAPVVTVSLHFGGDPERMPRSSR